MLDDQVDTSDAVARVKNGEKPGKSGGGKSGGKLSRDKDNKENKPNGGQRRGSRDRGSRDRSSSRDNAGKPKRRGSKARISDPEPEEPQPENPEENGLLETLTEERGGQEESLTNGDAGGEMEAGFPDGGAGDDHGGSGKMANGSGGEDERPEPDQMAAESKTFDHIYVYLCFFMISCK